MIHRRTIITLITLIFVAFSTKADESVRCNRTCGTDEGNHKDVPYPFGFSSGCEIRLNCTDGDIRIGEYKVQNITGDNILINIPAECNRTIQNTKQLFSPHYALTWRNSLMLENCSLPLHICRIPITTVRAQFESDTCGLQSDNISCYSSADNRLNYATYEKLERTGCRFLFTSIAAYENNNLDSNSTVSLQFQTAELEWWLNGQCRCSRHADCTSVTLPDRKLRFRCRCEDGFEGEGFADGHGCRRRGGSPNTHVKIGVLIVLPSVSAIAILIITIYYLKRKGTLSVNAMASWKKERSEDQHVKAFIRQYGSLAPKQYRYSDVNKMTNAFKEKLGEGGYGTVYKGKLSDGRLVAIKILSETKGNGEEFINEVASISRTSHINVVALLGFCFERNRRALVYEFVANGSLDNFIYNGESLDWKTLFQIAVGIAQGLEYLHRGCSTRIVHFDIKPHNILLDEDFCPKISDFGLAKLCQRKQSIISMLGARGTAGYIAPEVFCRAFGGISNKSDVYSYGMLILEIIGARENPGVVQASEVYFPQWIYEHLEHGKDLRLVKVATREEEETSRKMILVGLWCIQTYPSDRPSMSKVLEMLEGSLESLQIPPKPSILSPVRLQASACDSLSSTMDLEVEMSTSNPSSFQIPSKPLQFSPARSGQSTSSKTLA